MKIITKEQYDKCSDPEFRVRNPKFFDSLPDVNSYSQSQDDSYK